MVGPVTLVHVHHLLVGGVVVVEATELRPPLPVARAFAHAISAGGLRTVTATVEPVLVEGIAVAIATEAVVLAADCVLAWQGSTSRLASEHGAVGICHYLGPALFGSGVWVGAIYPRTWGWDWGCDRDRGLSAPSPREDSQTPSPQWQSAMQFSAVSLQNGFISPRLSHSQLSQSR